MSSPATFYALDARLLGVKAGPGPATFPGSPREYLYNVLRHLYQTADIASTRVDETIKHVLIHKHKTLAHLQIWVPGTSLSIASARVDDIIKARACL